MHPLVIKNALNDVDNLICNIIKAFDKNGNSKNAEFIANIENRHVSPEMYLIK